MSAFVVAPIAKAATQEEIEAAIEAGLTWLVAQQNTTNGSWGNSVARTGFAVVKLEDRAYELAKENPDIEDPFDPDYEYSQNVINGLNYIFSRAESDDCGIHFESNDTYDTGIAMMAIAAGKEMERTVPVLGSIVDGMTYGEVLEANVTYFANSQRSADTYEGGWDYECTDREWADNANSGYAALGLRYAEAEGMSIPATLKTRLSTYIDYIQNDVDDPIEPDDGGSGYTGPDEWVNLLKTGNLLFEMAFVGDGLADQRVQDAIDYIERHWNDPNWDPGWKGGLTWPERPHMQAAYCLMKGLEAFDIREPRCWRWPV